MLIKQTIWKALEDVKDPEIPAISVVDLGIITDVKINDDDFVAITMTPTFTGCPAIDYMKEEIKQRVEKIEGVSGTSVKVDFTISWSSNRISEKGKQQLKAFGLAPPPKHNGNIDMKMLENVKCPHCHSTDTKLNNPFGPTLCRSIHYCNNCQQAFQQFKPV